MTVYENSETLLKDESEILNPSSAYAKNKLKIEKYLKKSSCKAICLRIPGLYSLKRKNGLVMNMIVSLYSDKKPQLVNYPVQWAAMDVSDIAKSIYLLLSRKINDYEIINISYNEKYSINFLISIIEKKFNQRFNYNIEHPIFQFNLKKANKLKLIPKISFEKSILNLAKKYHDK